MLLCDAAFSAVPILIELRRRGYLVAVCGSRPTDPGHGLADVSIVIDYGDCEELLRVVRNHGVQFLVPGCTDVSYLSCSWVASQLGLPGYDGLEATLSLHKKDRFRALCQRYGFATPRSVDTPSAASKLRFPILVKPSDAFSGRGIIRVDHPTDLPNAIERSKGATGSEQLVFEEYVHGNLHSHSAFLRAGRIAIDFFVDEYCTVHPYQVNSSHVSVHLDNSVVNGIRRWLEAMAEALNLADGLVHTQFISNGSEFFLIETMRRCPGDLYALLVAKSTGAPYPWLYASSFCGVSSVESNVSAPRFFSRHTVSVTESCTFFATRLDLPEVNAAFVPLKKPGETLGAVPMDRAGIYFIEHVAARSMTEITPHLRQHVVVETLDDV